MVTGVGNTLEVIESLGTVAANAVGVLRGKASWGDIGKLLSLLSEVKDIIAAAPGVLPELIDVDANEAAQLGRAAYEAVKRVVDATRA